MTHFPKLESKRLLLNQIQPADIPEIVNYANNIKITENTRTLPYPYRKKDAISWIQLANTGFKNKDQFIFAMRTKTDKAFLGGIGLTLNLENNRAELGYWTAEPFWNKGYTTEAVKAILEFGFKELNLNKIVAFYLTTNEASGKVLTKNGMIKEGELIDHDIKKDHTVADGLYVSLFQYRLTHKEYKSLKEA